MSFVHIEWLYLSVPIALAIILFFYFSGKIKKRAIEEFTAKKLMPELASSHSRKKQLIKQTLIILGVFLITIALAQPQWGHRWEEQHAKGIDVLFALDTSKSMLAEDVRPNRLERAKYSILDLVKKLKGDRIGLLAFSGKSFLQCPLTLDYDSFIKTLEAIDINTIERGGTDIGNAIANAEKCFQNDHNFKFLVILSDGGDLEGQGIAKAREAAKNGVTIYTVGVGTYDGELIPIRKTDGSTEYIKDFDGKIVKAKLEEEDLKKIAQTSGGFYVPLGTTGEGLEKVYNLGLNSMPKQELTSTLKRVPIERFQWPLSFGIILLLIEMCIGTRKRKHETALYDFTIPKAAMFLLLFLAIMLISETADASPSKAFKAYENGNFAKASDLYEESLIKKPEDQRIQYNLGTSQYKTDNFESASHAFHKALDSKDLKVQKDSFFNIGNANYRLGQKSEQSNPQQTITLWEESLKNYENAIALDAEDKEAKENHVFVQKKLNDLKKEQEQQQQKQNQDQQQANSEQHDKENSSNSSQGNEDSKDNKNDKNKNEQSKNQESNQDKDAKQNKNSQNSQNNQKDSRNINDSQQKDKPNTADNQTGNEPQNAIDQSPTPQSNTELGRMKKSEAEQLLSALQNNEKKLPVISKSDNKNDNVYKDW